MKRCIDNQKHYISLITLWDRITNPKSNLGWIMCNLIRIKWSRIMNPTKGLELSWILMACTSTTVKTHWQ